MAPDLPGFYYDVEKDRYFKIVPHHLAREKEKQALDRKKRQHKRPPKQSIAFVDRISGPLQPSRLLLLRELGLSKHDARTGILDCWASELERRTLFDASDPISGCPDITHFVRDDLTGTFLYARGSLWLDMPRICWVRPRPFSEELEAAVRNLGAPFPDASTSRVCRNTDAPFSSLSLSRSRVLVATFIDSGGPNVIVGQLRDFEPYDRVTGVRWFPTERVHFAAWSSAANAFSTSLQFAIGFGGAVGEASGREDGITFTTARRSEHEVIFGVDWLDRNTIISGGRRGEVFLWDTRGANESSNTTTRFYHPAPINHIRKMGDGPQIAIAGLNESIHIQDLRILPRPGRRVPHSQPHTRTHTEKPITASQEPYMTFATAGGPVFSPLMAGFDVHGDLIAAGTADGRVQLFSVRAGRKIVMSRIENDQQSVTATSPVASASPALATAAAGARCIKFANEDGDGVIPTRLYVASGRTVQEWGWFNREGR